MRYQKGVTVQQWIELAVRRLINADVESPRLQVEWLLADTLGRPRLNIVLELDRQLTTDQAVRLDRMLLRRCRREPLQYVLGSAIFCGLEIAVNSSVLIPRPETELLAERGWEWLREIAALRSAIPRVLDFGTGSGCLAIALAKYCPTAQILAIDRSREALQTARRNAIRNAVYNRIRFCQSQSLRGIRPAKNLDLVISNPPYIPRGEIGLLAVEIRNHEPLLALDGGLDGLDFYRSLARTLGAYLSLRGRLLLEFGDGQGPAIERIFEDLGWLRIKRFRDDTGQQRILVARTPRT